MLNFNCKQLPVTQNHNFYLLGFNRKINQRVVSSIMSSIREIGIRRAVNVAYVDFIEGVKRPYIMDGQHLYEAIMRLAEDKQFIKKGKLFVPVDYSYPKNKAELISMMAKLNNTGSSWVLGDYVNAWSAISLTNDYLKLKDLQGQFGYTYSTICTVMNNDSPTHAIERMKRGKFKVQNESLGLDILDKLKAAFEVFPKGMHSEQRVFIQSYISFYRKYIKSYKHSRFINSLSQNAVVMTRSLHSVGQCTAVMEALYAGNIKQATRIVVESTRGSNKKSLIIQNSEGGKSKTTFLSTR